MNHLMRAAIVALTLSAVPFAASADSASVSQTSPFIAISGGTSNLDISRSHASAGYVGKKDDSDSAFGIVGGYRWVVARPFSLGVEVGYINLGKTAWDASANTSGMQFHAREKTKTDGILLGVNGKWDIANGFIATARLGVAHVRTRYDSGSTSYVTGATEPPMSTRHGSTTDNSVYGGVGFGYDFNENVGVTLTYDYYSFKANGQAGGGRTAHAGVTGVSVEYRFW